MDYKKQSGTKTSSFGSRGRINHDSSAFYNSKLYSSVKLKECQDKEENILPVEYENKIIFGNSERMKEIPDNSIHLMITSPPYNATKEYDKDLTLEEYLKFLRNVFSETFRVLVNGGRACINVANLGRKPYIPLSDYVSMMMMDIGYNMRGEIIWDKASSASPSTAWGSWLSAANPTLRDIHEYVLIFSKGDMKRSSNGKTSTISKEQFMQWTKSVWNIGAESAKKIGHPAPFPVELPYRLIQLFSYKDDIILDPFMGSGSTAIAAVQTERRFIGYDNILKYVDLSNKRLEKYLAQNKILFPDFNENDLSFSNLVSDKAKKSTKQIKNKK